MQQLCTFSQKKNGNFDVKITAWQIKARKTILPELRIKVSS